MRNFFIIFLSFFAFANTAIAKAPAHVGEELRVVVEASLPSGSEIDLTEISVRGKLPTTYSLELRCDPLRVTNIRALIRSEKGTQTGWVTAKASIRVPAAVVVATIPRGSRVVDGTSLQLVEAREIPRNAVLFDDLEDGVASRDLRPGKVVSTSDVVLPKLVDRGQPVELKVRRGTVVITVRGIALNAGRRGDVIRVKTSTAEGRTLEGVVTGPGACEVP